MQRKDGDNSNTKVGTEQGSLIEEMRLFRAEFQAMREDLHSLTDEIRVLSTTVASCVTRTDALEDKMEVIERRLESVESADSHVSAVQSTIKNLKSEMNDYQQETLLNDVDISGLPENANENPFHLAMLIASNIGVGLEEQDIVWAHRVGPPKNENNARARPMTVRFVRRSTRDEILRNARTRRGNVTTTQLQIPGNQATIFINERLTAANRLLFRKAREQGKANGWKFIWSRNGRILAKKTDTKGETTHRIREEDDCSRLFFQPGHLD